MIHMLTISGYLTTEHLYESAHSIVYRGRHEADDQAFDSAQDRPVILKLLKHEYPTPEELARFRRGYAITQNLSDIDGIIQVFALGPYNLFAGKESLYTANGSFALNERQNAQTNRWQYKRRLTYETHNNLHDNAGALV